LIWPQRCGIMVPFSSLEDDMTVVSVLASSSVTLLRRKHTIQELFRRSRKFRLRPATCRTSTSHHLRFPRFILKRSTKWLAILKRHRYFFPPMMLMQSMLYRFREQQAMERGLIDTGIMRRPKVITQVDSIPVCEKWRGSLIRQISRAVTKIQDRTCPCY